MGIGWRVSGVKGGGVGGASDTGDGGRLGMGTVMSLPMIVVFCSDSASGGVEL